MSFLPTAHSPQPAVLRLVAGVDEAGRGPLAGPVTAAAVILHPARRIRGIRDSKQLTPERREELAVQIRAKALAWAVGWAGVEEIDSLNILQATFLAMRRALAALPLAPMHVKVDGNRCPSLEGLGFSCTMEAIIQGDASERSIGAASILAKVDRDAAMRRLDAQFPEYGFATHKGYGTAAHRDALLRHGPSPVHRRSFAPVKLANLELDFVGEDYIGGLEDCFET